MTARFRAKTKACALMAMLAVGTALAAPFAASPAWAQERAIAFTGAQIIPIAGAPIENGTIVIEGGKIVAVGADVAVPADAERRDATGRTIMPGIVDTHSHIGQVAGADYSGPIQPEVRAMDSIDPRDASIAKARAGGVTTANVMPGSGHLLSGQTFYMKLRDGNTVEEIAYLWPDGEIMGGMKMANGTNPLGGRAGFPGTRAKSAALLRNAFVQAKPYCAGKRDKPDLGKEGLCDVLSGKRLVHFHTHMANDIITVLRLAEEFDFKVLIQHGTETYKVVDELAAANVPVSNIVLDAPGGKLETRDLRLETAGILERAGILVSLHSDDPIIDSRMLVRSAALAVRGGMSREGALAALTINGARQLGLEDRVGTLEPGKDADLVIFSGDPLSVYTKVLETWVEGERLFDAADPEDAELATGGYGVGNPRTAAEHHWELRGESAE